VARLHLARVRSELARAAHAHAVKVARAAHARAVKAAHARAHRLAALRHRLMRIRVLPIWRSFRIGEGFGVHGWHWGSGMHTGIDLDVPIGTHVHAAMAGTVISAHWEGSYGNCIRIRHYNGVVTRYAHLSKIKVKVGQYVQAGQVIANSGNTGNTTGPHLHFEVIIHGTPVNPKYWLR
jgi:murein DD-endopeptidase MepM/ murein hydrolase activator NlpD